MRMPVIPFSRANALAKTVNASNALIGRGNVVRGIPGFPGGIKLGGTAPGRGSLQNVGGKGMRLGNMPGNLSDYINSPGTPGSSTFYMYGLSADEDVTTSTSPTFASALQSIVGSIASTVPAVANAVTQISAQKAAQAQLQSGQISPTQYAQITGSMPPAGGFPVLTAPRTLGIGLPILAAVGLGAFLLLRKR